MKQYVLFTSLLILIFSCTVQKRVITEKPTAVSFYYSAKRDWQLRLEAMRADHPYVIYLVNGFPYTSLSLYDSAILHGDVKLVGRIPVNDVKIAYVILFDALQTWDQQAVFRRL